MVRGIQGMRRVYKPPGLTKFGTVGSLTLGANGVLPDYTSTGQLVNDDCTTETFVWNGITFSRAACSNATVQT